MRVAIDCRKITDFGIGTYVRGLVTALASLPRRHEYVAIVPSRAAEQIPPSIERLTVDVPNYSLREMIVVARAIRRARADVFHAPHINIPVTDVPTVVTLHDMIHFRFLPRNRPGWWYASVMTRRAVRKSAAVLTVSEASKSEIVQTLRCPPEKITVTPNGVDERFFATGPGDASRGDYLLYAGNDKAHKNVVGLVAAFAIVRRRHPSLRLVLAGAPFARFRGEPGVEAAGFVSDDELLALYRGAKAFVMPSFAEGFGLPAVEAMAAGTPAVTSATPALVEVTGDAALHVDPVSPEAIALGILRVLEEPPVAARLRRAGPERARRYSWRRCAELTEAVYEGVFRTAAAMA